MGLDFIEEIASLIPGAPCPGHRHVESKKCETAAPAGVYMVPTGDKECSLPTAAAQITAQDGGFTTYVGDKIASDPLYSIGDYADLVVEGYAAVLTEEAVSDGDPVYVRVAASGGNTQLGACRTDGDSAAVEITIVTTADGAVIEAEINGVQLSFETGNSQTAAQKATAFAAYVDGLAAFGAAAVGAVVTITPVSGSVEIGEVSPAEILTVSQTATAVRLPGAVFRGDYAAGAARVRLR